MTGLGLVDQRKPGADVHEDHDLPLARRTVRPAHRGETADDVIQAQDRHLKEQEQAGDESHQPARDDMKGRWKRPKKSLDWYFATKKAFAELSED